MLTHSAAQVSQSSRRIVFDEADDDVVDDDDDNEENDNDNDNDDDLRDFIVDDDGNGYYEPLETKEQVDRYYKKQKTHLRELSSNAKGTKKLRIKFFVTYGIRQVAQSPTFPRDTTSIQDSFQPASTPLKNNRRFLGKEP